MSMLPPSSIAGTTTKVATIDVVVTEAAPDVSAPGLPDIGLLPESFVVVVFS